MKGSTVRLCALFEDQLPRAFLKGYQIPYEAVSPPIIFSMGDISTSSWNSRAGAEKVGGGNVSPRASRRRTVRYRHPLGCRAIELGKKRPQGGVIDNVLHGTYPLPPWVPSHRPSRQPSSRGFNKPPFRQSEPPDQAPTNTHGPARELSSR